MTLFSTAQSILQELHAPIFIQKNVKVYVKRDDLIDEAVSGNKWRKLKMNMELVHFQNKEGILTFGGAFSNHLLAVAAACRKAGLKSIGIVRGDELTVASNANLTHCAALGMELIFVSRTSYAERNEKWNQESWKEKYPSFYFVPEGGANYHGMVGCQEIITEIPIEIDHFFVAQGTSTTSCGVLTALPDSAKLHVVPALKGFDSLNSMRPLLNAFYMDESSVLERLTQVVVHDQFHFGGYGKIPAELRSFGQQMQTDFSIPLDGVYTAKAFFALMKFIETSDFLKPTQIVFLHTGGVKNAPL